MKEKSQEESMKAMTKEDHEAAHGSARNGKAASQVVFDEMSTAATKEEFEKLLKEGKPFQLKPKHSITVASIDETKPPIVQIQGDFKVISSMFFYALSEIMHNAEKHGMPREEMRLHFHEGVELAYKLSEL